MTGKHSASGKPKSFFYHYNKPQTLREGKPIISLHYDGVCHFVEQIEVKVPCQSKISARQPRFVMKGKCRNVVISENKATIS